MDDSNKLLSLKLDWSCIYQILKFLLCPVYLHDNLSSNVLAFLRVFISVVYVMSVTFCLPYLRRIRKCLFQTVEMYQAWSFVFLCVLCNLVVPHTYPCFWLNVWNWTENHCGDSAAPKYVKYEPFFNIKRQLLMVVVKPRTPSRKCFLNQRSLAHLLHFQSQTNITFTQSELN